MELQLILPTHKHCELLREFVENGRAHLPGLGRIYDFEQDAVLYTYGDPVENLYWVTEGRIRTSTMSPDGRELVTGIYGPGQVFGQFCLCREHHRNEQAIALTPARIVRLGVEELLELVARPAGAVSLLQMFCQRISALEEQVRQLAFYKVRTRLALLLLRLSEEGEVQADGSRVFDAPTHEEMARRIGTSREQVTSLLAQFRKQGLVQYERTGPLVVFPGKLQDHLEEL